ncbi:hypothetical protein HYH03_008996 [Edaphochlamys debaryana]|uniref:Uncharacterized protein n=1 Tax=Edaphochlamys debaryana TaxID=47281 RepID=A0A835XXC8_9CHLO|nr:hypothetical protein HYH03_008996 [Edaphochlamys debaryana]|eukprot:KAG2492842.1 hypothetical protein HYH03_008996 [Edaphochlamys debaryana]
MVAIMITVTCGLLSILIVAATPDAFMGDEWSTRAALTMAGYLLSFILVPLVSPAFWLCCHEEFCCPDHYNTLTDDVEGQEQAGEMATKNTAGDNDGYSGLSNKDSGGNQGVRPSQVAPEPHWQQPGTATLPRGIASAPPGAVPRPPAGMAPPPPGMALPLPGMAPPPPGMAPPPQYAAPPPPGMAPPPQYSAPLPPQYMAPPPPQYMVPPLPQYTAPPPPQYMAPPPPQYHPVVLPRLTQYYPVARP